jgi:tRNA pseudouridine32 synthase/23S rRNA pseudouridine746 synthase
MPVNLDAYDPPLHPWLDILYEDRDILVINKPAGLLSVPGRAEHLQDSVTTRVLRDYPLAHSVHRLDAATSGVLVVALRRKAEKALKLQFQQRLVSKVYVARVGGIVAADAGLIDLPLIADWPRRPLQKVCHESGKPAQTLFRVLQRDTDSTLLELKPVTGRSHQLRVHMLAIGHPILGDRFYADNAVASRAPRLLLHACLISFLHPYTEQSLTFTAPVPFP